MVFKTKYNTGGKKGHLMVVKAQFTSKIEF